MTVFYRRRDWSSERKGLFLKTQNRMEWHPILHSTHFLRQRGWKRRCHGAIHSPTEELFSSLSHTCKTEEYLPPCAVGGEVYLGKNASQQVLQRNHFPSPPWVTPWPQGSPRGHSAFTPSEMSQELLSGPDSIRLERPQATAALPVPSCPFYNKFWGKHTKQEENSKVIKSKSCPHQEGLWSRGPKAGGRDSQAAVGIGGPEPQQTVPSARGIRKQTRWVRFPAGQSRGDLQTARRAGLCASSGSWYDWASIT